MDNYEEINRLEHLKKASYKFYDDYLIIWFIGLLISVFGLVSVIFAITTSILIWKILAISMIIIGYIVTVISCIACGILRGEIEAFDKEIDHMIDENLSKKFIKL